MLELPTEMRLLLQPMQSLQKIEMNLTQKPQRKEGQSLQQGKLLLSPSLRRELMLRRALDRSWLQATIHLVGIVLIFLLHLQKYAHLLEQADWRVPSALPRSDPVTTL